MYKPVRYHSPDDSRHSEERLAEPTQFELIEPPFKHTFRSRKGVLRNPWRLACIVIGVVFVIFLVFNSPSLKPGEYITKLTAHLSESQFTSVAIQTAVDDPVDYSPLKELCDATAWQEGVVLQCYRVTGGMGNIRNIILNCVRFAIEAGGALVLPDIVARSQNDLAVLITEDFRDFDYMFDRDHLISTLSRECPQLKVYPSPKDLEPLEWAQNPLHLNPLDLAHGDVREWAIAKPASWRRSFDEWLKTDAADYPEESPVLVNIGRPVFQWPMGYESAPFQKAFGRILQYRKDARELAAETLYELSQEFSVNLDPAQGLFQHAFYGAHLRTAKDAKDAHWPGYEAQSLIYLSQAEQKALSIIYVSSGSATDVERFTQDAAVRNIQVIDKASLLKGDSLERLQNMTWDQQGIVDYEVLLKCSSFGGISPSSFSWNVALRRNILSSLSSQQAMSSGPYSLSDEFSVIYGSPGDASVISNAMWP